MKRMLQFLHRRRGWTLALIALHLSFSLFAHRAVSDSVHAMRNRLTPALFDTSLTIMAPVALLPLLRIIISNRRGPHGRAMMFCGLGTLVLLVLSYRTLMSYNSELIHFPQYALLALPVFALTSRCGTTVLWVALLGFVDELYQFFAGTSLYLDFNDILLNLLGGGLGVLLIYLLLRDPVDAPGSDYSISSFFRSPAVLLSCLLIGLAVTLWAVDVIRFDAVEGDPALLVLSRSAAPNRFWLRTDVGKVFHILRPLEFLFLLIPAVAYYLSMDFRAEVGARRTGA